MLDFIKGYGTGEYRELLTLKPEYNDAIYLDISNNRLYYAGKTLDVRVVVEEVLDEARMVHQKYHFTNPNGETVTIDEALIPEISGYTIQLHDVSSGTVYDYKDGLQTARDKFLLDTMAKLLGISINYTYWATVHHYSDVLNGRYEKLTEVEVYRNENGEWQYDYDDFEWEFTDTAHEIARFTFIVPAGSITLRDNGLYGTPEFIKDAQGDLTPMSEVWTIDIGNVIGRDELSTVAPYTLTLNRQSKDFNFYDGGGRPENQAMLNDLGGLKAGTTVGELERETVSEVISKMLFEEGELVKTQDTSAYIKFHEDYIETNNYNDGIKCYIEIGAPYPLKRDFETVFLPETWQVMVGGKPEGEPQEIQKWVDTSYYISDYQHPWRPGHGPGDPSWNEYEVLNEGDEGYMEHYVEHYVESGDKSLYYGIVHYEANGNAKDQYGNETYIDAEGVEHYYAEGTSGDILARNMLGFTGNHIENPAYKDKEGLDLEFSLEAAWRIFSNASETSKETIWKARNEEPAEGYLGNDAKVESCGLAIPNQCIYFKWPSATRPEDGFYIYLPAGCQIEEIGAAHDGACDEWSVKCTAEIVRDEEGVPVRIPIENRFGHTSDYLKYSILKSAVITNVRVMFNVLDPNA